MTIYIILAVAAFALLYFLLSGPSKAATHHDDPEISGGGQLLRGTRVLGSSHTAEIIAARGGELGMVLAGIPIPKDAEVNGFLFAGAPGVGKTIAFHAALAYARRAGHKAIVVDNGAEFLKKLYRPGIDVILNAFDVRSKNWSIFAECKSPYDSYRLAKSIVPDGTGESAVWASYSQSLLSSVMLRLAERGGASATTAELVRMVTIAPLDELQKLCEGLPASSLMADGAEKMFSSIRADCGAKLAAFAFLQDENPFSLTDFIKQDGDGWVFISYRQDQFSLLSGLISAMLDVSITATLSLTPDRNRRIVFALDEFSVLPKINSILDLLTRSRKAGGVPILGLQSVSQPRSTYGKEDAETILSCLSTLLALRSSNPESAEWASKWLGKQEIKRITQSQGGGQDQGIGWSEQVAETFTVLPSTLQNLPKCEGYLSLVGDYHPARVLVPFPPETPDVAEAFVERDFKAEAQAREAAVAEENELDYAQVPDMTRDLM